MLKIVIDVEKHHEPGAESLGDFVQIAAAELMKVGKRLNTEMFADDLLNAMVDAEFIELEKDEE